MAISTLEFSFTLHEHGPCMGHVVVHNADRHPPPPPCCCVAADKIRHNAALDNNIIMANNDTTKSKNTTTRTVTLASGFPTNGRTITLEFPLPCSAAAVSVSTTEPKLEVSGHFQPYKNFENYRYEYSTANDTNGTIVMLCGKASYIDKVGSTRWVSLSTWRTKNKENKNPTTLDKCRCKGRLVVLVSKDENQDWVSLAIRHDCDGGVRKVARTAACGGGGIVAQETVDAHTASDVGGGDEIVDADADGDNADATAAELLEDNNNNNYDDERILEQGATPSQYRTMVDAFSEIASDTREQLQKIWDKFDLSPEERALREGEISHKVFHKVFHMWNSTVAMEEAYLLGELGSVDEEADGGENSDAEDGYRSGGGGGDGGGETLDAPLTNDDDQVDNDEEETGSSAAAVTTTPSYDKDKEEQLPQSYDMTPPSESSESDDDVDDIYFCLDE